ncbi:MAG: hypothetical protein LRY40_05840 [Shewanella fodinae]|nr:hypothetical protein [Shewanella fodinae]
MNPMPTTHTAFLPVVKSAILTPMPGQANKGLWLSITGILLALFALSQFPSLGVVTSLCLAWY